MLAFKRLNIKLFWPLMLLFGLSAEALAMADAAPGGAAPKTLSLITPNISQTEIAVAKSITQGLFSAISRSGGVPSGGGNWSSFISMQRDGLQYTPADYEFDGSLTSISLGMQRKIGPATLGALYAYSLPSLSSVGYNISGWAHNFGLFARHSFSGFDFSYMLAYSAISFKNSSDIALPFPNFADYDAQTFSLGFKGVYKTGAFAPYAQVLASSYIQDEYVDALGLRAKKASAALLTLEGGSLYNMRELSLGSSGAFPYVSLGFSYDILPGTINAELHQSGTDYEILGEDLPRFGIKPGLGVKVPLSQIPGGSLELNYTADLRDGFSNHSISFVGQMKFFSLFVFY